MNPPRSFMSGVENTTDETRCQAGGGLAGDGRGGVKNDKGFSGKNKNTDVIHPTVIGKIGREQVRMMIDTGASSSYISSDLLTKLGIKRCERRNVW